MDVQDYDSVTLANDLNGGLFSYGWWPRSISGEFRILIEYVVSYSSVVLISLHSFDK